MLHIVLTLLQANPANVVAALIAPAGRARSTWACRTSSWSTTRQLAVLLNYGAAALAWLLITQSWCASPSANRRNGSATRTVQWSYRPGYPEGPVQTTQ